MKLSFEGALYVTGLLTLLALVNMKHTPELRNTAPGEKPVMQTVPTGLEGKAGH